VLRCCFAALRTVQKVQNACRIVRQLKRFEQLELLEPVRAAFFVVNLLVPQTKLAAPGGQL
jgi:hypothetical protein